MGSPTAGATVSNARGVWPPTPQGVGVPAGTVLSAYTGPCTITTANTVIDKKTINCSQVDIQDDRCS